MINITVTYKPYILNLKKPFVTAKGEIKERKGFLVTVKDQNRYKGTGDCAPFAEFGSESYNEAFNAVKNFSAGLYIDDKNLYKTIEYSLKQFVDFPALKHGFEQALVNYFCSKNNLSMNEALGYSSSKYVDVNAALGFLSPEEAEEKAKELLRAGFKTIKLKAGRKNFDDDFDVIRAVRSLSNDINIRIDVNGKWKFAEAEEYLSELKIFKLEYVEQPVAGKEDFAELKSKTKIPIAADESLRTFEDAAYFIFNKSADVLILKPMLLGGIVPLLTIFEEAKKKKIKCVVSSSFESVVGRAYALFAASLLKNNTAHGLGTAEYFESDLYPNPYPVKNGQIKIA